ncbi:MAG: type III secretion system chaperone [Planctomycetota bacterium]
MTKRPRSSWPACLLAVVVPMVAASASAQATQPGDVAEEPSVVAPLDESSPPTDNATLDRWIREVMGENVASQQRGHWEFSVAGRPVIVLTDEVAGRMRIITPVAEIPDEPEALLRLMQANFDSALDARYAAWQGRLWSAFIHPLPTLTKDDFYSGVGQVVTLAATTGTTYSSSGLTFGGEEEEPDGPSS